MERAVKAVAVSDTHHNQISLKRIVKSFSRMDYLFHLGDNVGDALYLEEHMPRCRVISVGGNCDFGTHVPDFEEVVIKGNRIILTHGHMLKVKYTYDNIYYYAREHHATALFFGHTHEAYKEYIDGIWLINPGSAGESRGGELTVCTMLIKEVGIIPKIVKLGSPFIDF